MRSSHPFFHPSDAAASSAMASEPILEKETAGTILIVDDEPMVTVSIKAMLALETDYTLITFNNPQEALDQIDALAPEVIISDFLMPEMDGITFLQAVKERLPETTLILLTGYSDKESAIQAINRVGIYRYIEKPWENEELKLSIKNGLERARLLRNLRATISQLTEAQEQLKNTNQQLETLVEERTLDLRAAYQTLESIIQNTADGIITLNEQLAITSINPPVAKWLARWQEEHGVASLRGVGIQQVLSLGKGKSLAAFFKTDQRTLVNEALMDTVPVEVSISPIPEQDAAGENKFVLVVRDIVARKEIERLRDDFMSTLTHDLRTPLLAAIQTLGFFVDGSLGQLPPRQQEILTMLIQSNREMLGLVNVLLEVYKYESGRQRLILDQVDLAGLLTGIQQELQAMADSKNQTLTLDLPSPMPDVTGDKQELRRVFVNLIGNAIHYTQAGGQITVSAKLEPQSLTLLVGDNGRGIPEEDLVQLFQRFSQGTSKQRSSGSGLGLYLSRQIVEAHHGHIWVESTEGVGSRFYVQLPLALRPA